MNELEGQEVELFNSSNPRSLVNLVADKIKSRINELPPDLFLLTEKELKKRLNPTPVDYSIRSSFWREFEKSMQFGVPIKTTNIFGGICSEPYFYQKFLADDARIAWMILPMQRYQKEVEAILFRCLQRLWDLVEMDIEAGDGTLCPKRASVLLDVVKSVENRARGMAVMRTESKNLNVQVGSGAPKASSVDLDKLDARIAQLSGVLVSASAEGVSVEKS